MCVVWSYLDPDLVYSGGEDGTVRPWRPSMQEHSQPPVQGLCPVVWLVLVFPPQIDLFGLYILFSHFRPRDATRGNSFFQMSSYARANLRITNKKTKGKFP